MKEANYVKRIVIALGGNAILQVGQEGSATQMRSNLIAACRQLVPIISSWYQVMITHGNGPQVGNILIQNEQGKDVVPALPLDVCGAQSQGMLGYLFQQELHRALWEEGNSREITALVTSTVVSERDPAFSHPTKPIGPWLTRAQLPSPCPPGITYRQFGPDRWRRVVASPYPMRIINIRTMETLLEAGVVVVACGGGGVPVVQDEQGVWRGVEAVIDKDLASMRLAQEIKAQILLILTDVPAVYLGYGTSQQRDIARIGAGELREHLERGDFPAGSIGPKVEAAVAFVEGGGERAIISNINLAMDALKGKCGTLVVPDDAV